MSYRVLWACRLLSSDLRGSSACQPEPNSLLLRVRFNERWGEHPMKNSTLFQVLAFSLTLAALTLTASAVDAQCLSCWRDHSNPPPVSGGTCAETQQPGLCDRDCCNNIPGAGCRMPDYLDPCFAPWTPSTMKWARLLPFEGSPQVESVMEHVERLRKRGTPQIDPKPIETVALTATYSSIRINWRCLMPKTSGDVASTD